MRELTTDDNLEVTGEGACIMGTGAGGFAVARVGGLAGPASGVCIGGRIDVALYPCRGVRVLLRRILESQASGMHWHDEKRS